MWEVPTEEWTSPSERSCGCAEADVIAVFSKGLTMINIDLLAGQVGRLGFGWSFRGLLFRETAQNERFCRCVLLQGKELLVLNRSCVSGLASLALKPLLAVAARA